VNHRLRRAGAELDLEPSADSATLSVRGHLFVELADGRRLHATDGPVGARFGDFFGDHRVDRAQLEKAILGLVGKDRGRPRPPDLAWEQLRSVLSAERLVPDDEELLQLPFDLELSRTAASALGGVEGAVRSPAAGATLVLRVRDCGSVEVVVRSGRQPGVR
jgi:hypothetical protein